MDTVTPTAAVIDLDAAHSARRAGDAAEVAGRRLHAQLVAEAEAWMARGADPRDLDALVGE